VNAKVPRPNVEKPQPRPKSGTGKEKAAAVLLDSEAYRRLVDFAARDEGEEGIRQGMDDALHGRTRPAREFFNEFESKHEIACTRVPQNPSAPVQSRK
jgi:hypothetical protein